MNIKHSLLMVVCFAVFGMLASQMISTPLVSAADCGCQAHSAPVFDCGCQSCGCDQCQPEEPCQVCCERGCRLKRTCASESCRSGCGRSRRIRKCPSCSGEFCDLEIKQVKVKKKCFKTEQKAVCIPSVQLPWKKCAPRACGKTRVVNVLKTHSYKCPKCECKWTVKEPECCDTCEQAIVSEHVPVLASPVEVPGQ